MAKRGCDGCPFFRGDYPREKYTTMDGNEYTISIDYAKCKAYKTTLVVRKRDNCWIREMMDR